MASFEFISPCLLLIKYFIDPSLLLVNYYVIKGAARVASIDVGGAAVKTSGAKTAAAEPEVLGNCCGGGVCY